MANYKLFFIILFLLSGCDNKQDFLKEKLGDMVFVKGGSFDMGDFCPGTLGYACTLGGALPVHKVTIDSYYISKYKVSYKDYDFYTKIKHIPNIKLYPSILKMYPEVRNPQRPAVANWQLSRDYCIWLGQETGLPIDLPTEAQWEYAARNRGENILYATNNGKFELGKNVPSPETIRADTKLNAPYLIGKYPPTPLGLYDMGTDSPEWVYDWYQKDWYQYSTEDNPKGPESGIKKVVRGIPVGDSRDNKFLNRTAVTTFRTGREPLLRRILPPPQFMQKYNNDYDKAKEEYNKIYTDPYQVAKEGFGPFVSFRCVINSSSLNEKVKI